MKFIVVENYISSFLIKIPLPWVTDNEQSLIPLAISRGAIIKQHMCHGISQLFSLPLCHFIMMDELVVLPTLITTSRHSHRFCQIGSDFCAYLDLPLCLFRVCV